MKERKFLFYIALQGALFVALIIFHVICAANGFRIYDRSAPNGLAISILQISLTAVSFIYSLWIYLSNRHKGNILFDLFTVYFLIIYVGDIFFSGVSITLGGHISFLCAYLLFMVMRRARAFEYCIVVIIGVAGVLVLHFLNKLTPTIGIDFFVGSCLGLNCISMWHKYLKTKERLYLLLSLGVTLIFLSDLSIAGRTFVKEFAANTVISMVTWPTYIIGNVLLNYSYKRTKEQKPYKT